MELVYKNEKIKKQCTSVKAAQRLFGGDTVLARSLLARVNALAQAENLKDIIVQPAFHFHNLVNKKGRNLEGYFAVDVKSRKEKWRIIIEPLNDKKEPFQPCEIDKIANMVKIVEITEVSGHYE